MEGFGGNPRFQPGSSATHRRDLHSGFCFLSFHFAGVSRSFPVQDLQSPPCSLLIPRANPAPDSITPPTTAEQPNPTLLRAVAHRNSDGNVEALQIPTVLSLAPPPAPVGRSHLDTRPPIRSYLVHGIFEAWPRPISRPVSRPRSDSFPSCPRRPSSGI